jgi:hypothetical protein
VLNRLGIIMLSVWIAALLLALPSAAFAHERRMVEGFQFVVGWTGEPAYLGQPNGVDFGVSVPPPNSRDEPKPVEGLEKTVKVEVIFGAERRTFDLEPQFRRPGRYSADIVPTRTGDYRFRFFGTINGKNVDVTFDSADGKFDGVESTASVQFPQRLPDPVEASGQLADAKRLSTYALVAGLAGLLIGLVAYARSGRRAA